MKSFLSFVWFVFWESFIFLCFSVFSLILYCLFTDMPNFMPPVPAEAMDPTWLRWLYVYGIAVGGFHLCCFLVEWWAHRNCPRELMGSAVAVSSVASLVFTVYKRYYLLCTRVIVTVSVWFTSYAAVRSGESWGAMSLVWIIRML